MILKEDNRKKVVFLGTPEVAAKVLDILVNEAQNLIKIVLVVSQPPARSTRHREAMPSPVHTLALSCGIPVLTPETAKDPSFLEDLEKLEPDLCITAAYGNYLPASFLSIPKFGTLNIHPSLLPCYRGAAPVQRAIENGETCTGVSILYTVQQMDAGPIVAQESYPLDHEIKAPELLNILFERGTKLLISSLSKIFRNDLIPVEQDHSKATHAAKVRIEESFLDFAQPAEVLHNKVRAFASWPGTRATFLIDNKPLELKIVTTRVREKKGNESLDQISFGKNSIEICCGDGSVLEILEIQPPGKKVLSARDFQNGLQGKSLKINTDHSQKP